jgi:argininosuccinate lyase
MKKTSPVSRSGRFTDGPAADVARFTESISFDWRLWRQDIAGSIAHATMLRQVGCLTQQELRAIIRGLDAIGKEIEAGRFRWQAELEDVHMNIEAALTDRVPAGAKLHTGRSRNDQVALDMRLWLREQMTELQREIRLLQRAMVRLGEREREVIIPGYTHLQRAQPVYLAHHLLAYVEMLARDAQRLQECFARVNVCPLGSGALAGSTLPLDRELVAELLGFVDAHGRPQVTQNSMDAVSDRDFAVEFCSGAALLGVHLSRLAEDLVLWSSSEFNFIRIADAYTTGSSLMPQKKNPDVAELIRGKSSRMIGNLVALLTLLKGLPMTYNRDLQEDKERLFDTSDTVRAAVRLSAAMLDHTQVNREACRAAASDPALLATDLADYLVRKGLPFRQAHHAIGALVALAERLGKRLNQLTLAELRSVEKKFGTDVLEAFDLRQAMARRRLTGAPGTQEVGKQLARWKKLTD